MVRFSNIADLNLNTGALLDRVGASLGNRLQRESVEAEKQRLVNQEQTRQEDIALETDNLERPNIKPNERQASLIRLARLNPNIAKAVDNVLKSGDARKIAGLNEENERGFKRALILMKLPTHEAKKRMIFEFANEDILANRDPEPTVALSNLSEDELNNEILKDEIIGTDVSALIKQKNAPQQETFSPIFNKEGLRIGQESSTGKRIADPTLKEVNPQTDIGKARKDLRDGLITRDDFNTIQKTPKKFQSSVGKLIGDRAKAVTLFGNSSSQVKAFDDAIASEQKGDGPKLSETAGIRKEFTKLSGDFIKLRDAMGKVEANAANPSAAGDLSLIFNFMKILDPGSVVRESEFATASNSASVPERVRAQYNRALNGERLSEKTRADFLDTARELFNAQEKSQIQIEDQFRLIAERAGIKNTDDVVIDFKGPNGPFVGDLRPEPKGSQEGVNSVGTKVGDKVGKFIIKGIR